MTAKVLKSSDGTDWLSPSVAFRTTGNKRYLEVEVYDASGKYLQAKKSLKVTVKPTYFNSSQEKTEETDEETETSPSAPLEQGDGLRKIYKYLSDFLRQYS
jgi:hypothetical protein